MSNIKEEILTRFKATESGGGGELTRREKILLNIAVDAAEELLRKRPSTLDEIEAEHIRLLPPPKTREEIEKEQLAYAKEQWKNNDRLSAVKAVRDTFHFDLFTAKAYCEKNF